jgi:hypothetical protein
MGREAEPGVRRGRRFVHVPPDLTSLFDVLFIIIFAVLIRAASAEKAAEPPPAPPPPAPVKLDPKSLQVRAADQLASRPMAIVRVSTAGTITAIERGGSKGPIDLPLLEHSADPDVGLAYLGDRSAEMRVCRIAQLHGADLAHDIVVIAPERPLADLPHALVDGLHADIDRCGGLAVIVDALARGPAKPDVVDPSTEVHR